MIAIAYIKLDRCFFIISQTTSRGNCDSSSWFNAAMREVSKSVLAWAMSSPSKIVALALIQGDDENNRDSVDSISIHEDVMHNATSLLGTLLESVRVRMRSKYCNRKGTLDLMSTTSLIWNNIVGTRTHPTIRKYRCVLSTGEIPVDTASTKEFLNDLV